MEEIDLKSTNCQYDALNEDERNTIPYVKNDQVKTGIDSISNAKVFGSSREMNNDRDKSVEVRKNETLINAARSDDNKIIDGSFKYEFCDWRKAVEEFDSEKLTNCLIKLSKEELSNILKETEKDNNMLSKENLIYHFLLQKDEFIQFALYNTDYETVQYLQRESLSDAEKFYFARKRLEYLCKDFDVKKEGYIQKLQNLKFQLESVNMLLKDLKKQKEKFYKNVKIGGRHPVTKKVILQKVVQHFENEIKAKTILANAYKMKIHSDITERNKVLNQINVQKKRIATLDVTQYQEAKFEYTRSSRDLALCKDQLANYKIKFSPLLQSMSEMKKALEKEQEEMDKMKNAVERLEHLKQVMMNEKLRNDKNVSDLRAAMRKIKLDPRRHNLPEVIEYAAAKRINADLKEEIKKWKKKVETIQQEKFLYLSSLSKRV